MTVIRDRIAGGAVALLGLYYILQSLRYGIGSAARMESGFFPLLLGILALGLGIGIMVQLADRLAGQEEDVEKINWRAVIMLPAAIVAFAATIRPFGLVPAVFLTVLISSFADRGFGWKPALVLAIFVTIFSTLIFKIGLELQVNIIRWPL